MKDTPTKLNSRDERFVDRVAKGDVPAKAYAKAGFKARGESARVSATKKLQKPTVATALEKRKEHFRSIADVEALQIIGAQVEIAFASIEDALDDDGRLNFKKAKRNGSAKLIKKISRSQTQYGESVSVEFYSRSEALAQLTEILGLKQMPRENSETMASVLQSFNAWLELNPQSNINQRLEAIADFARLGKVDQKELAIKAGVQSIEVIQ